MIVKTYTAEVTCFPPAGKATHCCVGRFFNAGVQTVEGLTQDEIERLRSKAYLDQVQKFDREARKLVSVSQQKNLFSVRVLGEDGEKEIEEPKKPEPTPVQSMNEKVDFLFDGLRESMKQNRELRDRLERVEHFSAKDAEKREELEREISELRRRNADLEARKPAENVVVSPSLSEPEAIPAKPRGR